MTHTPPQEKSFDPALVLSVVLGQSLGVGTIDNMHEIIEHACGHPVWTHELASPEPWDNARKELLRQYPDIPTEPLQSSEDNNEMQRRADDMVSRVRSQFGDTMVIQRGTGERTESPITSLQRVAGDRPVIVMAGGNQ